MWEGADGSGRVISYVSLTTAAIRAKDSGAVQANEWHLWISNEDVWQGTCRFDAANGNESEPTLLVQITCSFDTPPEVNKSSISDTTSERP